MAVRNIIHIDEEKCDGCGLCVTGCAEGALQVIDGKARLISEVYCDGLGACLGECLNGALTIVQREAEEFDEKAVEARLAGDGHLHQDQVNPNSNHLACGCPSTQVRELPLTQFSGREDRVSAPASALRNWPVQLHLAPTKAPFFKEADLLIAATCSGFALTDLHRQFLPGRTLIIACPKLDDISPYETKLVEIFRQNYIRSLTVLYLTVPCCFGLVHLIRQALKKSGKSIPLRLVKVDVNGEIVEESVEQAA